METPRLDTIRLFACLSGLVFAAACAGGTDGGGTPGAAGSSGGASGGAAAGTSGGGGAAGSGVAGAAGNASGNAGSGGGAAGGGAGGSPAGTAGSSAGTGGSAAGTGGSAAGTGGSSAGRGGSGGGAAGAAGRGGQGGSTGGAAGAGGGGPPTCPANATFCSGFEAAGLPAGAIYMANAAPGTWDRDFAVDTSVRNSGSSSLRVKSGAETTSGSMYKMLAVPATMNAFWVRFFVRSDMPMGGEHNAFAVASVNDTPNDSMGVEFAEDVGIAFNASDVVRWPTGYGRLTSGGTNPYMLPANTWHCVEISFDGTNRVQQLFINGAQLINATDYPSATRAFRFFKFGFNSLHGPNRQTWYDDLAVAPTRIGGC
jgi:hypothetical protein